MEPIFRVYVNKVGYISPASFLITPKGDILLHDPANNDWIYPPQDLTYVLERYVGRNDSTTNKKVFEGDLIQVYDGFNVRIGTATLYDGALHLQETDLSELIFVDPDKDDVTLLGNTTWGEPYNLEAIIGGQQ